jgi:AraC-like DNA-binding protein
VQKIAEQLRYTAVQSFNRAFRRATGMSPGDYRRLMQKQEQRQAEA